MEREQAIGGFSTAIQAGTPRYCEGAAAPFANPQAVDHTRGEAVADERNLGSGAIEYYGTGTDSRATDANFE